MVVAYEIPDSVPSREIKPRWEGLLVWINHWGFARDPFADPERPYVSLPSHDEAVARLIHTIETSRRLVVFNASAGLGKTTVLRKVLAETRNPRRVFASIACPSDGTVLFTRLAEQLGNRLGRESDRLKSWMALDRSIRAASLQGIHVVLVIDNCHDVTTGAARRDLDLLAHLGTQSSADLTIVRVARSDPDPPSDAMNSWLLAIGLEPLTRSQVECYLATKMKAVGCAEPIFTPRAITRLQALSGGVPRGVEEIASLSLMAGALRGLEVVPPEVVDGVAAQLSITR
jgi:general secretion pathway protein A